MRIGGMTLMTPRTPLGSCGPLGPLGSLGPLGLLALLAPLALLSPAPAVAQSPVPAECQPMMTAGEKQFTVPSHAFMTTTGMGPAPMQSEVISISGATYVKVHDRWMKSPLTPEQLVKQSRDKMTGARSYSCKQLPDEAVGGVAASIYSSHTESGTGATDTQVWIAKGTGLPLKSEVDMKMSGRKSHVSVRYEYANVQAPPMN
jgi:hypothetical protein